MTQKKSIKDCMNALRECVRVDLEWNRKHSHYDLSDVSIYIHRDLKESIGIGGRVKVDGRFFPVKLIEDIPNAPLEKIEQFALWICSPEMLKDRLTRY